jgi:hypothetical protein
VEQAQVELIVRVTARISAGAFALALMLFAAGPSNRSPSHWLDIRAFVAFILAHTIHFGAVAWLAALTAGDNIHQRGGWAVVLTVAVLFYLAAFQILRVWHGLRKGRSLSRGACLTAHGSVALIAVVFLNSYLARVGRMPLYWVPAIGLVAIVAIYFARLAPAASASGRRAARR